MTTPQSTPTPHLPQEEWRPVVGWEDLYEVSNLGRVRAIFNRRRTKRVNRVLRWSLSYDGYPRVTLCRLGQRQGTFVHRLVAEAFIGPRPEGTEVHHEDDNRANPLVTNLRYVTRSENQQISVARGRASVKPRPVWSEKVTPADVVAIRGSSEHVRVVAARYGIAPSTVYGIRSRRAWAHIPDEVN